MKNTIPYSKPDSTLVDHVRAAIDAHKANSLLARAVRAARSVA